MRKKVFGLVATLFVTSGCIQQCPDSNITTSSQGEVMFSDSDTLIEAPDPKLFSDKSRQFSTSVIDRVLFHYDQSKLSSEAQAALRSQASWLHDYPAAKITIEGHCDERGTTEYNLGLGERRANAAKEYLMSLGIHSDRIRVISYGKERPIVSGHTEDSWAKNRVAVTIVD